MAPPSPAQLRWRHRIEMLIRLAQPGLDLVLAAGDRLSRTVDRSPDEPVPAIPPPSTARRVTSGRPGPR